MIYTYASICYMLHDANVAPGLLLEDPYIKREREINIYR